MGIFIYVAVPDSPMVTTLKPNKNAFIWYSFIVRSLWLFVIFMGGGIAIAAFTFIPFAVFPLLYILQRGFGLFVLHIQYRKAHYELYDDKFIWRGGSIFSDYEVELVLRNVTHVHMILPWIENKLLKTGGVLVQSAGSSSAEIAFVAMDHPEEVYAHVVQLLQKNGFQLTHKKLVHQEKPHILGVVFETIKVIATALFFVFVFGAQFFTAVLEEGLFGSNAFSGAIILSVVVVVAIFGYAVLRFLDLMNRDYRVYEDMIVYKEGFLTKHHTIMPMENLADAETTQTIVDRIFGLYDVKLSTQGAGKEVLFKNLKHGKQLEAALDDLVAHKKTRAKVHLKKETVKKTGKAEPQKSKKRLKKTLEGTSFTTMLRMDAARTLFFPAVATVLLFILFIGPTLVLSLVGSPLLGAIGLGIIGIQLFPYLIAAFLFIGIPIVKLYGTRYYVKEDSFEERFKFVSTKNIEFTNQKITAVVFRESIIDLLFKTMTVEFWSIGSSAALKFKHIKRDNTLLKETLEKLGFKNTVPQHIIPSRFSLTQMMRAWIFGTVLTALITLGLFVVALAVTPFAWIGILALACLLIGVLIYKHLFYERTRVELFEDFVRFQTGLVIRLQYFSLYDNVKDVTTTRFPLSESGVIRYNVAGEQVVQQGKNKTIVSNSFAIWYVKDIDTKDELMDYVFSGKRNQAQIQNFQAQKAAVVMTSGQDAANTAGPLALLLIVIIGVISIPFAFFGPFAALIILPLAVGALFLVGLEMLRVRMISYVIEPHRIIKRWGIIYKKQHSVLFTKVDYINKQQGMLNKLFRNGSITVNTIGSSRPEIIIANIPVYQQFYDELKNRY